MLRRLNLGDIVSWDEKDWFVDATGERGTRLSPVLGGLPAWVDVATVSQDPTFQLHGQGHERGNSAVERLELAVLATDVRDDVLFWRDHLNEARYGVTDPADVDALPRDGYGPETTVRDRFALKAEELTVAGIAITSRTLFQKDAEYRDKGIAGLIDRRKFKEQSGTRVPPEVDEAAHKVIRACAGGSTRTEKAYIAMVKARVREDYPDADIRWPSERTLRRYLGPLLDAAGLTGTATGRRSASNRPDRYFAPIVATGPGDYVEIDTNILDIEVVMPDGTVLRPHMTLAIDVFTRSIVGFHVHAGAPTSFDHAVLLARILRPRGLVAGLDESERLGSCRSLPASEMVALGQATLDAPAMPFIVPETITTDRGKDYLGTPTVAAAQMFGISVIQSPPHSPTAKPHVERAFKTINTMLMSHVDSYVGHSPDHRGRDPRSPVAFVEVDTLIRTFIVRVYQNRPHSSLVLREHPGRTFTPNQMYTASYNATAGIPLPVTEADYIALMPSAKRIVGPDGVKFEREVFDSPALAGLRGSKEKRDIRHDPYDSDRIWVLHPDSGEWIECANRTVRLSTLPFGGVTSANLAAMPQAADTHEAWAAEFLATENARVKQGTKDTAAAKRAGKKAMKSAAEMANRKNDDIPRPGPVLAAPLPPATPMRPHPDDYSIA